MSQPQCPAPPLTSPPPPLHRDEDEVDLSEESVAGEEDPGAALDEERNTSEPRRPG